MVLTMEYDIWDFWVFGLCPSFCILNNAKNTTFRELDLFPSSGEAVGDTKRDPLERASPNHWTWVISF
jgi:hypothetical protein